MGDAKKANEKLGWAPKITLEELVDEMIKYDYQVSKREYFLKIRDIQQMNFLITLVIV